MLKNTLFYFTQTSNDLIFMMAWVDNRADKCWSIRCHAPVKSAFTFKHKHRDEWSPGEQVDRQCIRFDNNL